MKEIITNIKRIKASIIYDETCEIKIDLSNLLTHTLEIGKSSSTVCLVI